MKKGLSLIFILALFLKLSIAQKTPGHFEFTQSDLSGNGPTPDGKGYIFNFNNGNYDNCKLSQTQEIPLNRTNDFFAADNTIEFDNENGYVIITPLSIVPEYRYYANFVHNNCQLYDKFIDVSDTNDLFIEIKMKSNIDLLSFNTSFGYFIDYRLDPLSYSNNTTTINANEWTIRKYSFKSLKGDPALKNIIGFSYSFRTADEYPSTLPVIYIDYIKIGSAVNSKVTNLFANSFVNTSDTPLNCVNRFNVMNNENFTYSYDSTNFTAEIQQLDAGANNQYFANIFSDQSCFFSYVDFSDPATQLINISIMPELDIPYFSVDLNGYTTEGIWDVGKITNYVPLKKGRWNDIMLPLNLATPNNTTLDPKRITGYGLIFDSIRTNASKVAVNQLTNSFKLKTVIIGSYAKTDFGSTTTNIINKANIKEFNFYPNPSTGTILLDLPFEQGDITILNSIGIPVKSFSQVNNKEELSLGLERGIYLLQLQQKESDTAVYISKLIIQ